MSTRSYLFLAIALINFEGVVMGQWIEERQPYPLEDAASALVYLKRFKEYDYKYDESGSYICDLTVHEIVKVNNDDALEAYNRIYIPIGDMIELLDVKSRTITPAGKIIMLDKGNIQEVKDEEAERGYRIFAVEGAEVGGEIEYLYTKRIYGRSFVNELYQFDSPVKEYRLLVSAPKNLEFDFSAVNHDVEIAQLEGDEERNAYEVMITDVPAHISEAFSGGDASKRRIDFKLSYNSAAGNRRLNTFSAAGKRIYDNLTPDKDEVRLLENYIKKQGLKGSDKFGKLRKIEHSLKQTFYTEDNAPDDLQFLFENNFGSKRAMTKMFAEILRQLDIRFEVVLTSNRFEMKFDPDFDNWNYLTDYLLYFPDLDAFMAPHHEAFRVGSVPPNFTATKGLFISPQLVTDFEYPVSRIDYIPAAPYRSNMNNLDIQVELSEDLTRTVVNAKRTYIGDEANFYKYALLWMDDDRKKEMLDDVVKFLATDAEIEEVKVEEANNDPENWHDPFVVSTRYASESYVEVAGSTVLFKLGNLIGPQSELYQEEERNFEVENLNNRGYARTIVLDIPEGYELVNPEDIILDEKVYSADRPVFVFESSYRLSDNQLHVTIDEYYDQIFYPKEDFEAFRKVINAAADWNKVTLVLKEI